PRGAVVAEHTAPVPYVVLHPRVCVEMDLPHPAHARLVGQLLGREPPLDLGIRFQLAPSLEFAETFWHSSGLPSPTINLGEHRPSDPEVGLLIFPGLGSSRSECCGRSAIASGRP